MRSIANHPVVEHPSNADAFWLIPVSVVALVLAGAIAALLAGMASPDVIGADGMASTAWMVP